MKKKGEQVDIKEYLLPLKANLFFFPFVFGNIEIKLYGTLTLSAVVINRVRKLVCRIMGKTCADSRIGCRGRYLGLRGRK